MSDRKRVLVLENRNATILRSSFPFENEDYLHPKLRELRTRYGLDSVVSGCSTEFEKILALKNWTAQQNLPRGKGYAFPPWDALYILDGHGYWCLQYAIVFLQACLAYGIPCRHVEINAWRGSGHEVTEVWSNDYGKWVFVDPQYNYHVCDGTTGIPLSVQEFQAALFDCADRKHMASVFPGQPPVALNMIRQGQRSFRYVVQDAPWNRGMDRKDFLPTYESAFFFLRIIPRNNFLGSETPLPLNHGTTHWLWDGYINWRDRYTPELPQYSRYVSRKSDLYWTVNQVHFHLLESDVPETLMVDMDTVTPGMETYLACVDKGAWEQVPAAFQWKLKPGRNTLDLCVRNTAGVTGPVSGVVVQYIEQKR